MTSQGIITHQTRLRADTLDEYLTYPFKANSSLWICLNPKDHNKAITREHYKAPMLEEITHRLSNSTTYLNLDAKNWFWSTNLSHDISLFTTFNTHLSKFCLKHMPFGQHMLQDFFQIKKDHIVKKCPNVLCLHNRLCVFGKTEEENDYNLLNLI